ncbi:Metal dependent phosphohydrolase, HD region (plasmid) [Neorhizobium galegae bv. officinalis bv. officinalis str. HAMBI 1141]|jgi:(p)ppGpp synthase/HD superfamily hydrolase|uniref:Metal dependent phosphohydrolase, HD region n=1 Tax=Neorhizobium galegae bv. officinalis bv. officinalis str. HAMBI 1141 TaxID=1028801 RepID=A0A068TET8_NEOGA|nr:HD domain-containing protein [Neorhizobium galegae]CDN57007.1 Metal dependent phosphohydrolase, HD region [Neorhizobium galegae bv. officinalis bv. officinalis str. HAMBI 1141]
MSELIDKAIVIATEAHEGQSSKTGGPFIDHVRRVAENVAGEDEKQVAWLHDVVEKGPGWTFERLREEGFSKAVVDAVDAMSKRDGEEYFAFVRRSIENPLARPVKRADLTDNLAQMRQMGGDGSKFAEGLRILNERYPS